MSDRHKAPPLFLFFLLCLTFYIFPVYIRSPFSAVSHAFLRAVSLEGGIDGHQ